MFKQKISSDQNKPNPNQKNLILREKIVKLNRILKISENLRAARNTQAVLKLSLRIFTQLGFQRIRIWRLSENQNQILGLKANHIPDAIFQKIKFPLSQNTTYLAKLKNYKPFVNQKITPLKKKLIAITKTKIDESLEFPLIAQRKLLGKINLDYGAQKKIPLLNSAKIQDLVPIIPHFALALDRVILTEKLAAANRNLQQKVQTATLALQKKNAELTKIAHYDTLSGLPNRRYFDLVLSKTFAKAKKHNSLTLGILDLDFFKQINDHSGHTIGDQLITQVGQILSKNKKINFAARYAGDEFVILIKKASRKSQTEIFQNLVKTIQAKTHKTVSIGVANYPLNPVKSSLALLKLADDALYQAKQTGRNRFVSACESPIIPAEERHRELQKIIRQSGSPSAYIKNLEQKIQQTEQQAKEYARSLASQTKQNSLLTASKLQVHLEVVLALVASIEEKDRYTCGHSARVAQLALKLGQALNLEQSELLQLRYASLLHDLGKIAIEQALIRKTTQLTKSETKCLRQHPQTGAKIVRTIHFLRPAAKLILHHHERWDGQGYPTKLKGPKIPLGSRIIALADSYDAMTTERGYNQKKTKEAALRELHQSAQTYFDPKLTRIFLQILKKS